MKCEKVKRQLSLFLDEMLDQEKARMMSGHLARCPGCHREFERLTLLRRSLGSLDKVEAPEYLFHLVQLRLANERNDAWRMRLRAGLEYYWSRIRTTEGLWFGTRLLGTAATFVLFIAIVAAVKPMYFELPRPDSDRGGVSQALRQQLPLNVLKNLGLTPVEAQKRPITPSDPQINDLYLLNFGQNASRSAKDDSFSVFAVVDRSGSAKIRDVLEYPADSSLLSEFNDMLLNARCRPASQNGRAVDSHLVMTFSKISVYD